jgi:hypothetical protein
MLIHNADITGSLTINGIPYNTGSYTGIFKSGTNIISGNTVILTGSFTGSFLGDGSQLSGVTSYTDADTLDFINSLNVVSGSIQTLSTVSDTFTSVTSYTVTHNFGTKQVIVSVYENDTLIFPSSINTPTTNTVTITFPEPVTGRVVVVKAGHVVSGSINYTSVLNKPTLVSGSSQISFTGITNKPTLISGSAQIAALGYATTGSNQFKASQVITGSLTVTDAIVAQTLNVQQVTSSVIFSSGSNVFGNSVSNTQQFTGSVNITGSLTTSIATLGTAATTFLTSDGGTIKSRTAAQTLSDIGGQATGSYVTVATNQSITGQKTFTKNINVNGVYVGRGASSGDLFAGISGNTAVGDQALLSISTGFPNTAVGAEALRNITTGANNIAIGSTAGKLISAGTANETSTTSIYIGNDTRPSANGNTNEIVIGHTTTGNGSNTVTIGNSSITNTYLKGAVTFASTVTALGGYLYGQTVNSFVRLDNSIGSQIGYLNYADVTFDSDGFKFFTGTGTSGSRAQKLVFNSTGNVGIGSNSPNEKLEVQDGYISTYHNANINDAGYGIQFYTNGGGSKNSLAYIGLSQVGTARSGNLLFQTSNAGAPSTKMTITSDGKVGIGAPSPSSLLEVAGGGIFSLQLSGNLTNATRKFAFIQGKHYTNSEEPIAMIGIDSQSSTSTLYIGGGLSSELNAATEISFQTGATNTTLTGTERLRIASGGLVTVTGTGAGATSEGIFFKRTSNLPQGGYINGSGGVLNIVATDEHNSNNGNIYFQRYNGTTVSNSMVINSNGVVLINNTFASPYGVLNTFKTPINSTYVDQIVVQGTGNYPSLRLGTYGEYDGVIATTGNDLRILAGLDVSTENHSIRFYTSFIGGTGGAQAYERMRIESDGVVQVRSGNELRAYRPDNARYGTFYTDNNTVVIAASVDPITLSSPERIVFSTAGTERMRINSSGFLKVSNNSVYNDSAGAYHEILTNGNNSDLLYTRHTAASPYGMEIYFSGASPNNTTNWFTYYYDTTNVKAIVYSNGTFGSRTGTYGSIISDINYKQDIVNANSQWDDIKNLRVVNFRFKEDVELEGDGALRQIGFIAQEVEQVSPNLVYETTDRDSNKTWKSVKTSIIEIKAIKALQEVMAKIESLEAENDNLKSRLEVLEQS